MPKIFSTLQSFPYSKIDLLGLKKYVTGISCLLERKDAEMELFLFDPLVTLPLTENFESFRRKLMAYEADKKLPPFAAGFVGYLGYDVVRHLEAIPLPPVPNAEPDACLFLYGTAVMLDHGKRIGTLVVNQLRKNQAVAKRKIKKVAALLGKLPARGVYVQNLPAKNPLPKKASPAFTGALKQIRGHIRDGDIFQCVISEKFKFVGKISPTELYRTLRDRNPSPYHYHLSFDGFAIVGASPEPLVCVSDGKVSTFPIAGTRPRGKTPEEDKRLELQLRRSRKEQAEHVMLVDLARNDLGRVASAGSVHVECFMETKRFSHVMHLVSRVTANLAKNVTAIDALLACFPAGTLTGAPKIKAMQIIAQLETKRRGIYGGAIVLFDFNGNLDSCITIRSAVVRENDAEVQAGAGIVADSQILREYQEIFSKSQAVRQAIAGQI